MNAWIENGRVYEALQPYQVAAYLRSHGWRKVEDIRDVASVWISAPPQEQQTEIILPIDRTVGDFAIRMAELMHALTVIEHRAPEEILTDITVAASDVMRLSFAGETYDDGTIPIETGARLVSLTRDVILAAASVSVKPRAVLPTRKPDLAVEFLNKVRLAQTERGSYVLTVQSPVPPALAYQPELMPDPDSPRVPYERLVMLTL